MKMQTRRSLSLLLAALLLTATMAACTEETDPTVDTDASTREVEETDPKTDTQAGKDTVAEPKEEVTHAVTTPDADDETKASTTPDADDETDAVTTPAEDGEEDTTPFDPTATAAGTNIFHAAPKGSPNADKCVVIDAGHQKKGNADKEPNGPGSDTMKAKVTTGATGAFTGQLESELNLRVALYLRNELVSRGYNVVMIRETADVDISNAERAQVANQYKTAFSEVILIRIHANSFGQPTAKGAETICQSASNPYPNCAAQAAAGKDLSADVLREYCALTGLSSRGVKQNDTMTGINWTEVPSTILEMGFLSNETEDNLMATDAFRQNAAVGIANGIDAYFAD